MASLARAADRHQASARNRIFPGGGPIPPLCPTARAEDAPVRQASLEEKTANAPPPMPTAAGDGGLLFERADFDELLKPALERKEPALAGKPGRSGRSQQAPAPRPASPPGDAF